MTIYSYEPNPELAKRDAENFEEVKKIHRQQFFRFWAPFIVLIVGVLISAYLLCRDHRITNIEQKLDKVQQEAFLLSTKIDSLENHIEQLHTMQAENTLENLLTDTL